MSFFKSITEECVESKAKVFKTQPRKIGHCPWPQLQMARNVDSIYEGSFKGPRLTPEGHVLFVAFFFFAIFELNEKDFYNQNKNTKIGMCQNPDDRSWTIDNRR